MSLQKESGLESYKVWYPTVRETLSCLGKLYRCVEPRVFAGLAQDAVTACTASVQVPPPPPSRIVRWSCAHAFIVCCPAKKSSIAPVLQARFNTCQDVL